MEFQAVLDAVRSMPVKDQQRLVDLIQDEWLGSEAAPDLTPAMVKEIQKRAAEYDADPSIGVPWEQVKARLDKQLEELGE